MVKNKSNKLKSKSKSKLKTKKHRHLQRSNKIGGEAVAAGSYGCVFRPPINRKRTILGISNRGLMDNICLALVVYDRGTLVELAKFESSKSFSRRFLNVDQLTHNKKRTLFDLSVNSTNVDTQDANREKLHPSKEHDKCYH